MNATPIIMLVSRFHPHIGGTESQALNLSRALVSQGRSVTVITHRHDPSLRREEVIDGVQIRRVGWSQRWPLSSLSYILSALLFLRTQKSRVILHAHMVASPAVAAVLAQQWLGFPTIVKIACSGTYGDIETSKTSLMGRWKLSFVFRHTKRFIVLNPESHLELLQANIDDQRIVSLPNAVDTKHFKPDPTNQARYRRELSLPEDGIYILFAGRLSEQKRPHELLNLFNRMAERYSNLRLVFLGGGPLKSALEVQARQSPHASRIHFCTAYADMERHYRLADIFFLPSVAEGMSNSLLEAMASGLCCIASSLPGNQDVVENESTGLLFSRHDWKQAELLLQFLLDNPDRRRALGANAAARIQNAYSMEKVAASYSALYDDVIQEIAKPCAE